jgi:hypothetical protein
MALPAHVLSVGRAWKLLTHKWGLAISIMLPCMHSIRIRVVHTYEAERAQLKLASLKMRALFRLAPSCF